MDFQALGSKAAESSAVQHPMYKGRHCQADADVFAYDCADLDQSVEHNFRELKKYVEAVRVGCGAEHVNLHLTMGAKGGRNEMATVKEYQAGRSGRDPAIQERVWQLRHLMVNLNTDKITAVPWVHQEADDGMAQYQTKRRAEHGEDSSVIYSIDKDLWMVEGLHQDIKSKELYRIKGYGVTKYKDVGNVKPKLIGRGTSWFWHQMIMGDKADDIPGLPMLSGRLAEIYLPCKKPNPNRKALKCGEAKAVAILKDVTSDKEACTRVLEAYSDHYGTACVAHMFEQGFLLWMRRTDDELDLLKYWKDVCGLPYKLTPTQTQSLQRFIALKQTLIADAQTSDTSENT